jgi:putative PIG3 family NAD(P)H quinone oxidoreductase
MRAVTVTDGALVVADREIPTAGGDGVLVRVHGAGLNRADLLQRAGRYPAPPDAPPDVPGLEFAGIVEQCGPDTAPVVVGDRVFGLVGGGAHAEYLVVPAVHCAPVPDELDLVTMGGVPEAYVTAHDALVTRAALRPGEWVLVHAVGSGVGTAALLFAKALGARVVGTARTPEKLRRCGALGLDHGIVPPQRADGSVDTDALAFAVLDATGGAGVDVVLDLVGGAYVEVDVAAAAAKSRIVLIGALAGGHAQLGVLAVMGKRLTLVGTLLRARDKAEKADAVLAFARDVVPLIAARALAPVVERVVPLARAAEAYDLLASDATFGKVILDCRSSLVT